MAIVLVPLPDHDFDVTEVAVPWRLLRDAGHDVVFATEHGGIAPNADQRLLDGVIFCQLGAAEEAQQFYAELQRDAAFCAPLAWSSTAPVASVAPSNPRGGKPVAPTALNVELFDALLLPGGHAPRMRQYLGSDALASHVARFWALDRPVGAICHGVLVLARAIDPHTGRSVLHDSRTTCLPKYMERSAYSLTAWKLGRYYRTYPAYVEDEVRAALADPARQFQRGPRTLSKRGTAADDSAAFVVEDGRYVSARWPGDAYAFARALIDRLSAK